MKLLTKLLYRAILFNCNEISFLGSPCLKGIVPRYGPRRIMRMPEGEKEEIMKLFIGLTNKDLYNGCEIVEVAGKPTLVTPAKDAVNIVGKNIAKILETCADHDEIILTGPMAVWAYMVVFHAVVHKFHKVLYDDGKGDLVLIAMH